MLWIKVDSNIKQKLTAGAPAPGLHMHAADPTEPWWMLIYIHVFSPLQQAWSRPLVQ